MNSRKWPIARIKIQNYTTGNDFEGSIRNVGVHACGVIITPDDISKFVPVRKSKDADLLVTQFDNSVVESAGMLKMDFLGLKNLTIIKDCCKIIKHIHQKDIDPDAIPLDDELTYQLFQRGETTAFFSLNRLACKKTQSTKARQV